MVKSKHTPWGWQYSSVGKVSGILGAVDVNEIYLTPGSVSGNTSTLLRKGDQGERVKLLQQRLTICGWKLTTDGIWGERTNIAVLGLPVQDGADRGWNRWTENQQ